MISVTRLQLHWYYTDLCKNAEGEDEYCVKNTDFGSNPLHKKIFNNLISAVGVFIPAIILILLSVLIKKELNSSCDAFRSGDEEAVGENERRTARIGYLIGCLFLLCQTINMFINIMSAFRLGNLLPQWLWSLAYLLLCFNSTCNFLIYFINSGGVLKKVRKLCCKAQMSEIEQTS